MKAPLRNIKKGQIFSMVLCLLLAVGMMPITSFTTFADGGSGTPQTGKRTVMMGTSALTDPVAVTTDRGTYYEPTAFVYIEGGDSSARERYFVADGNATNSGNTSGLFLIMDSLTEKDFQYHKGSGGWLAGWDTSYAKEYINAVDYDTQGLLSVSKSESTTSSFGRDNVINSALNNEKLFLLSAEELARYVGNYNNAPGLVVNDSAGNACSYWLRSPNPNNGNGYVFIMDKNGTMENSHVGYYDTKHYGRLGANLDKSKVLFTTPYEMSKPVVLDGLQEVVAYDPADYPSQFKNIWGLTWIVASAEDAAYSYSCQLAEGQSTEVEPGDKVAFKTQQGSNQGEYSGIYRHKQSLIIKNEKNEALYYGRYANGWSKDWANHEITVPELPAGTYTYLDERCLIYGIR